MSQPIPGYRDASPTMQRILDRLADLGPVQRIGPGRWLATCPCCGERGGAEFADLWAGFDLGDPAQRGPVS